MIRAWVFLLINSIKNGGITRGLIETVNDQLKNLHQIDHTRHRSVNNFMVNLMAAIVSYCLSPNKPAFRNVLN